MNELLELVVLEGRKQDARVPLPSEDGAITIGVGYDCDIILDLPGLYQAENSDAQVDVRDSAPVVQLILEQGTLKLKMLDGSALVGDQLIEAGSDAAFDKNIPVRILDNIFAIQERTQPASLPLTDSSRDTNQDTSHDTGDHQQMVNRDSHSAELIESAPQRKNRLLAGAAQSIAGVLVLGGSVMVYLNFGKGPVVTLDDVVSEVQFELEAGGFEALSVASQEDNSIKVNGYLQNRSDLQRARDLVQAKDIVQWDVTLGESLADSVGSVFRVNGLDAEVAVVDEGVVSVNTTTSNHDLLERVEQSAYSDVPDLKKLELANEEPVVEVQEPEKDPIESLPGKRIVMIVASEPTYLQTEDGSRYFEGSILPSGHMITAILDETVHLQLEDERIELSF